MCQVYAIDTGRHTYVHTCIWVCVWKSKNEPKTLWLKGKGKFKVCSLIGMPLRRTKKALSGENTHSPGHIHTCMWAQTGRCLGGEGWSPPRLLFAFSYLSIQILVPSHWGLRVWSPFPREAINTGHCSVGRPPVKGLPSLGVMGASEHW